MCLKFSLVTTYALLYLAVHSLMLVEIYPGWGFSVRDNLFSTFLIAYILILLISSTLESSLKRFSDYFNWFVFSILFVPTLITILISDVSIYSSVWRSIILSASFLMLIYTPKLVRFSGIRLFFSRQFNIFFIIPSVALLTFFYFTFSNNLNLVGFEDIYTQRSSVSIAGTLNLIGTYFLSWIGYAFAPLILAYGLIFSRKVYVILSLIFFLFIWMLIAAKYIFVALAFSFFIFFLIKKFNFNKNLYQILLIPIFSLAISIIFYELGAFSDELNILSFISGTLAMRGLGIQAIFFTVYLDFFLENPNTYFSHISFLSNLIEYPYDRPLGIEIGDYMIVDGQFNANGNFWVTDGIASFGLYGVLLIGFVVGISLSIIDGVLKNCNQNMVILSTIPFILACLNVSFFTALLTGGGLVLFFLLRVFFNNNSYTSQ